MNLQEISAANSKAIEEMMKADPVWVDVCPAIDVIPGMTPKTILHAGPPIHWNHMCGPMKGAVAGALMLENLASTVEEAYELAASGEITFDACHNHSAVGPMAGVISAGMPVFVIKNKVQGNFAYCNLNEGRGKVLRYGGLGEEVTDRLIWMRDVLGPALKAAVKFMGELRIKPIMSEALHMGDDLHNRYKASSSLFANRIAPALFETGKNGADTAKVLEFVGQNDYTFLNLAMPALKCMADAGDGVEGSTIVTAMARNGTDFGLRISGLPGQWFTAPAPPVDALYFPGFSEKDANPDIGDSTITETMGFGGLAAAASPSVVQFVGGSTKDAVNRNLEMYEITTRENPEFTIPTLEFRGIPTGIDILKVIELNVTPALHTGVAHKEAGVGQIGAGCLRAPMKIFQDALQKFSDTYLK
ncbi:YlbE family protein [Bacilliculturomica massiliensis]|uniref:DUF1116 domain-containing protein n=1 Tax=Bacilliculturomica massiliensis TaxID=1917867 RepID=UPI0010316B00|nr:DUF1116 domain-containing protein [Bacilliculturomica massiliensis]